MKILIITPKSFPNPGGVESHLDSLISEGRKKGHVFVIITSQDGKRHYYEKGLEVYSTTGSIHAFLEKKFHQFRIIQIILFWKLFVSIYIRGYLLLNKRKDIDIIHGQEYIGGIISGYLSKNFKKKCIWTIHTYSMINKKKLVPRLVKNTSIYCSKIFVSSEKILEELRYFGISNKNKIVKYSQWVDTALFVPGKKMRNTSNKINLLLVGRLTRDKKLSDIMKLIAPSENFNIRIIGSGPAKNILRKKHYKYIELKDAVEQKDLTKHYEWADYCIIPNIVSGNIPRTSMESLSCGTPLFLPDIKYDVRGRWMDLLKKDKCAFNIRELKKKNEKDVRIFRAYALKNFGKNNSLMMLNEYFY